MSFLVQLFAFLIVNFVFLFPLKVSMFLSLSFSKLTTKALWRQFSVELNVLDKDSSFFFLGTWLGLQFGLFLYRPSALGHLKLSFTFLLTLDPLFPFAWFIPHFGEVHLSLVSWRSTSFISVLRKGAYRLRFLRACMSENVSHLIDSTGF